MRNLLIGAAALCVLALPAAAQPRYYGDNRASDAYYGDNTDDSYSDSYRQGYREGSSYDHAYRDGYDQARADDAQDEEDVVVDAYPDRAPGYDPYGETTAQRHPLHGKYGFSSDGTSHVGGWSEAGPHTTQSMAMGAAGYGGGGDYSTGR